MDPVVNWACYAGLADGPERIFAASPEADDYLRRRECPVLSIHSLPGRAAWESALFSHQASHAIEWEGSSHFLHIERYRELAAVITGWLDPLMATGAAALPVGQESGPA
jgi:pimeloyl-ACP methyl ester carboxylesterase